MSPSYLSLLGVRLLEGRGLSETDTAGSPEVCVVDEEFVRRFLRGRTVLGTRIAVNGLVTPPRAILREIVGVVGQVKERPDEAEPQTHVYVPIAQNPWWTATLRTEAECRSFRDRPPASPPSRRPPPVRVGLVPRRPAIGTDGLVLGQPPRPGSSAPRPNRG